MSSVFSSLVDGKIKNDIYKVVGDKKTLPQYGFKIHISSEPLYAQDLLNIVESYCISKNIAYKYIYSINNYLHSLNKDFDRFSSGKFITIYPKNDNEFKETIKRLYDFTKDKYKGPYILSDKNYKDSSVIYYRYGRMKDNSPHIITYKNESYIDDNHSLYSLPSWINEPFPQNKTIKSSYLLKNYSIIKCIHLSNSGGIYLGKRNDSNKLYIIKEARPYVGYSSDLTKDSVFYRKKEAENFNYLSNICKVPQVCEEFFDSEHYFVVVDFIEGKTLFDLFKSPKIEHTNNNNKDYPIEVLLTLIEQIKELHMYNFYIGDLSSVNIIQEIKTKNLYFIDLEHSGIGDNATFSKHHTPGFRLHETKLNVFAQDIQSLGLTYLSLYLINMEEIVKQSSLILHILEKKVHQQVISERTKNLLSQLIFDPQKFIDNNYNVLGVENGIL